MIFLKDKKLFICNPWLQHCAEQPKEVKGWHSLKMVGYFFFLTCFVRFALDLQPLMPYHTGKLYFLA